MNTKSAVHDQMHEKAIFRLLQLCAILIFFGRAYQFWFFGAPFRAFLWDESLLSPIVEGLFSISWNDYATNPITNTYIAAAIKINSVIFLLAGLAVTLLHRTQHWLLRLPVYLGITGLLFLAICLVKDKNYDILQFFELSIQLAVPVLLLAVSRKKMPFGKLELWLKIAIACTFLPHGLFAMGFPYVPGHFIDMTINILNVNENTAVNFLFVAGLIDIVLSVLIFIPRIAKYFLAYAVFWGLVTAFARIVAGFNADFISHSLHQHVYLTIYRLPHGLVPLAVLWVIKYLRLTIKD